MVSLTSAESEFCAIGSGCARGLTVKHSLPEILHTTSPDGDVQMAICTDTDAARHDSPSWLWSGDICRRVTCGISKHCVRDIQRGSLLHEREFERCWHQVSGKRGDGELYGQACNRPCEHFAMCDRCSPVTSDQCERRSDCGWVLFETSGKTTTGVVNTADSVSIFVASVGQEELSWL